MSQNLLWFLSSTILSGIAGFSSFFFFIVHQGNPLHISTYSSSNFGSTIIYFVLPAFKITTRDCIMYREIKPEYGWQLSHRLYTRLILVNTYLLGKFNDYERYCRSNDILIKSSQLQFITAINSKYNNKILRSKCCYKLRQYLRENSEQADATIVVMFSTLLNFWILKVPYVYTGCQPTANIYAHIYGRKTSSRNVGCPLCPI